MYDSYTWNEKGVPFFSSIPVLGNLFSMKKKEKVKSFFVIEIVQLKKIVKNPSHWRHIQELKEKEMSYVDTSEAQLDTVFNSQDKEVVDESY